MPDGSARPHDFGAALDALRLVRTTATRDLPGSYWAANDALAVIEEYIFERATADEMHARAGLVPHGVAGR